MTRLITDGALPSNITAVDQFPLFWQLGLQLFGEDTEPNTNNPHSIDR